MGSKSTLLKQKKVFLTMIFVALLAILAAACSSTENPEPTAIPTPDPVIPTITTAPLLTDVPPTEDEAMSSGSAFVESIEVTKTDGIVTLTIHGNLSDACTEVQTVEPTLALDTNTFNVNIITQRPDSVACAQVLTPFTESITLQTAELASGMYTVSVQDQAAAFELTAADQQPDEDGSVSISPAAGPAGTEVQVTASNLPANTQVELGVGLVDSEYEIVDSAMTDANGNLSTTVQIPASAEVNRQWVVVVEGPSGAKTISNEFSVVASDDNTGAQFDEAQIYLIALEDGGQSGEEIGCGDSAVPVTINIEPTVAPLTAAFENMFAIDEQYYGQSGLYNALHQSELSVQGIDIDQGHAIIALTGELQLGGTCDTPRVEAQLIQTALQYSTINTVSVTLNGEPLENLLSAAGS